MGFIKKQNKKYRDRLGGKLLALQNIIRLYAENSIRTLIVMNLPEIKKEFPTMDYSEVSYLTTKFGEDINADKELLTKLSEVFSTDGLDDPIVKDEKKLQEFVGGLMNVVTVENVKKHMANYDKSKESLDKILGAVTMANTVEHGEEFEAVTE